MFKLIQRLLNIADHSLSSVERGAHTLDNWAAYAEQRSNDALVKAEAEYAEVKALPES